ncbi:hypothetical protein BDF14DRAFT_1736719 [Spinellus fusiger]|nr:hypothetical protein BDF14DRAFT_1736719 [Spinellus fusiger]
MSGALKTVLQHYRQAEEHFFKHLSPTDYELITDHGQQNLNDSRLYGEIAFMLLELKPCVLIQFPCPERMNTLYQHHVLCTLAPLRDRVMVRLLPVVKTEEMLLTHGLVVYQPMSPHASFVEHLWRCGDSVKDTLLGTLLDYPGTLPSTHEEIRTMLEVVYYDTGHDCVLTTYAALLTEKDKVKDHFEHYARVCKESLGMSLELILRHPMLS